MVRPHPPHLISGVSIVGEIGFLMWQVLQTMTWTSGRSGFASTTQISPRYSSNFSLSLF